MYVDVVTPYGLEIAPDSNHVVFERGREKIRNVNLSGFSDVLHQPQINGYHVIIGPFGMSSSESSATVTIKHLQTIKGYNLVHYRPDVRRISLHVIKDLEDTWTHYM